MARLPTRDHQTIRDPLPLVHLNLHSVVQSVLLEQEYGILFLWKLDYLLHAHRMEYLLYLGGVLADESPWLQILLRLHQLRGHDPTHPHDLHDFMDCCRRISCKGTQYTYLILRNPGHQRLHPIHECHTHVVQVRLLLACHKRDWMADPHDFPGCHRFGSLSIGAHDQYSSFH